MIRTLALFLGFLVSFGFSPAGAPPREADPGSDDEFWIQAIRVETSGRIRPGYILAESQLVEGARYNKKDLERARRRINRLDAVLEAEYELEPAGEDGRFTLVLRTRDARLYWVRAQTDVFDGSDYDDSSSNDQANLGARYFFGGAQEVYTQFNPSWAWSDNDDFSDRTSIRAGYRHNGLLRGKLRLTLEVLALKDDTFGYSFLTGPNRRSEDEREIIPNLGLRYALGGDHYVTMTATRREATSKTNITFGLDTLDPDRLYETEVTSQRFGLGWHYDTTDSDFAPSRGWRISAGAAFGDRDTDSEAIPLVDGSTRPAFSREGDVRNYDVKATHFINPRPGHVFHFGGAASRNRLEQTGGFEGTRFDPGGEFRTVVGYGTHVDQSTVYDLRAGWSYDFFRGMRAKRAGELRLGTGFLARRYEFDDETVWDTPDYPNSFDFFSFSDDDAFGLEVDLDYRTAWGRFGLGLTWEFD